MVRNDDKWSRSNQIREKEGEKNGNLSIIIESQNNLRTNLVHEPDCVDRNTCIKIQDRDEWF